MSEIIELEDEDDLLIIWTWCQYCCDREDHIFKDDSFYCTVCNRKNENIKNLLKGEKGEES